MSINSSELESMEGLDFLRTAFIPVHNLKLERAVNFLYHGEQNGIERDQQRERYASPFHMTAKF